MSIPRATVDQALAQIADPRWAEPWDNVGWLTKPRGARRINTLLLTVDLTASVMTEAVSHKAELVIAYHPPIFSAIKRTDELTPEVMTAIEKRISIYSPHTALDAAPGGVCDWLVVACGPVEPDSVQPIQLVTAPEGQGELKLVVTVPAENADVLRTALAKAGAGQIGEYSHCSFNIAGTGTFNGGPEANPTVGRRGWLERVDEIRVEMACAKSHLPAIERALVKAHPYEEPAWELYPLEPKPLAQTGPGRVGTLTRPLTLDLAVAKVKKFLGLKHVRVASAPAHRKSRKLQNIAVCPGAGGSLFEGLRGPDLFLTGEMRHHDVLALNAAGASVILTDHTNTERGYLPIYRKKLAQALGQAVKIQIARSDRDPLEIV